MRVKVYVNVHVQSFAGIKKRMGQLQDSPYFSSKNQNGRHNFKIIKMVVLMYEIIKTVVLLLF